MMNYSRTTLLNFVIHAVGLCLFINGFFPPRVTIPPTQNALNSPSSQCLKNDSNSITRLVLMFIDGWRSDFLFSRPEQMPFLSTHGSKFECKVQQPTVTMPRLKAFLSGIVPSYLDVALNLASKEFTEDNWLKRARKDGKKVVFYGDDTWLSMLPNGIFESRSEGTVSFFVTDYTEVDDNVTRHLNDELKKEKMKEWNILILHYLGLDHIGHSVGAKSNLINVKLNEMDSIAKDIYYKLSAVNSEKFAFIILGDHGMAEEGGHGGATFQETQVPVVILRPNEEPKKMEQEHFKIEQVDLVPTISTLFGFQIPANSLGVTFVDKFESNSKDDNAAFALWSLLQNGNQLRHLLINAGGKINDDEIVEAFDTCLAELSTTPCDGKISSFTMKNLISKCYKSFKDLQEAFIDLSSEYKYDFLIFGIIFSFLATAMSFSILKIDEYSFEQLLVFVQPLLNFASSYVEQEHHIWNFLFSSVLALKIFKSRKSGKQWTKEEYSLIGILIIHRICETLKQYITVFLPADNQNIQAVLNLLSIITLFSVHSGPVLTKIILSISLFSDPFQIPSDWFSFSGILLLTFYLCLLTQILFAPISDSLLFWTGNSHSLATLDLSSAYTRLPFYNPILVGIQLFIVGYSGPIMLLILRFKQTSFNQFADHLLYYRSLSMFFSLAVLFVMRHHLFVWSVFAPKLVYEIFHFSATAIFCLGLILSSSKRFFNFNKYKF
uniref:GPI ethanolamine phosphate transferase 2 n=1 Tax=Panagrolaimus sp. ES5 TaxID=591445 RepID=A0AC34GW09_9BILA